jgi:NADH:ubiquinone oxidoreductase subunit 5 (subunit L)/multisubunit Na+/H+ antiporter MnhA subunit
MLFFTKLNETRTVQISFVGIVVPFLNTLLLILVYFLDNSGPKHIEIFNLDFFGHHFLISVYIDILTLLILFLTGYLSLLVGKFSHTYLHREVGFQRYYATILLFIFGMQVIALAGTYDLFFAGWEAVGISSFLLISFYRNRTRPTKNAFRIFSIYHLCDTGLLMGAMLAHQLLHEHTTFSFIASQDILPIISNSSTLLNVLCALFLVAAIGKSGQFPVMNWPARAMEGPTPSSAIFYGALSIHCGVILLLRSHPLWQHSTFMHFAIGTIGILTFSFSTLIGRIQSNIKGQIAYAASAQIGVMFIALAFNQIELVMVHFFCHAIYRCYQILISPSIVIDHIKRLEMSKDQISKSQPSHLYSRIRATIYCLGLQEGMLEISERGGIFIVNIQLKLWLRKIFSHFLTHFALALISCTLGYYIGHQTMLQQSAYFCAGMGLSFSIHCLMSLDRPKVIWRNFGIGFPFILLAPFLFSQKYFLGSCLYAASAIPFWFIGNYALRKSSKVDLNEFNGLYRFSKRNSNLFMMAFFTFNGLPFTTTFLGLDFLLFELVSEARILLVILLAAFTFFGLASARIFCKVYFGHPRMQKY